MQAEFDGDLEFAVQQHLKGASLIEAKAAFADVLKERLAESKKKEAKPDEKQKPQGQAPISHSEGGEESADDFRTQAKALAKEKSISMSDAIKQLKKDDPDLFARSQNK